MIDCIVAKNATDIYYVFLFCLRRLHSVSITSPAPAGQISMKFDVEDYYENLWRNSKFG